ncbi:serine/threonine-protein kinase [Streptomyces sp. TRM68367]|uniref:serine/threonine-protein kinase n=1 Tax=Streptomyces sp. TRM68367 TaxID=2758415 RepID=UPI00165C3E11|nr:serine/threonine-protein kinase [Streptomyces sp. TRM68367]MBC9725743.1 serine/threonine protein kinase [Streptomyces sp. TRM68367]
MSDGGEHQRDGRLVAGRYRLIERIGSGGTGTVWRALDKFMDREVAVKQPWLLGAPEDEDHRRAAGRLHREARAAARVDHPAAVTIHDVVVDEDGPDHSPWIVMELIRGESLREVLGRGPVPAPEAARVGLAVLGALRAAHAVGIVHRDLKPGNVLLGTHGRVVLTDFGIAYVQGEESGTGGGEADAGGGGVDAAGGQYGASGGASGTADGESGTSSGESGASGEKSGAVNSGFPADDGEFGAADEESRLANGEFTGSLDFTAPERMSGRGSGPASDLWSLGVLLYAAVEGRLPFHRTTPEATLAAILAADPPAPTQAGPLGPLIVRLLAQDPEERPDADEVAEALGAVAGAAVQATPETSAGKPTAAQSLSRMREFVAVSEAVVNEAEPNVTSAAPQAIPPTETEPPEPPNPPSPHSDSHSHTHRHPHSRLLRPAPLALFGALLLLAGTCFAASRGGIGSGAASEETATTPATPPGTPTAWTPHRVPDMKAVLALPADYQRSTAPHDPDKQPRIVTYENVRIHVRLTQWDRAPRSPMAQARQVRDGRDRYPHHDDVRTQFTGTSVQGHEAVLADSTFGPARSPVRVLELVIRTDDGRMYALRVDMPKGTPEEKQGTAVFHGARDRLEIGTGRTAADPRPTTP